MNLSKLIILFGIFMLVLAGATSTVNSKPAFDEKFVILTPDNTVNIRTVVDEFSMLDAQMKLSKLDMKRGKKDYPIYIVLNTPGGSIYTGEQFIQFAKTYKNIKTVTIFAASMGAIIVESLPAERLITENGVLMFHRARGGFEGQFAEGEVEEQLRLWSNIVNSISERVASRLGISLTDYKHRIVNEWWIYGKEAIKENAVDRVVDLKCTQQLIDGREVVQELIMGFIPVETIYSACPLLTLPLEMKEQK